MFEKYKVEDLFLAHIWVNSPQLIRNKDGSTTKIDNYDGKIHNYGYSYKTVVWKNGEKYVDLAHKSIKINEMDAFKTSYIINRLVPLSNYIKTESRIGKRKALRIGKKA